MFSAVEWVLSALEAHGCATRRSGRGWMARCPAHDDANASLSIGVGDDDRVLLHCFAGCSVEAIVAALGLTMADLMPAADILERGGHKSNGNSAKPPRPNGQGFATASEAVAALERRHGRRSALWTYHDADGKPVGAIVRWDTPDGKTIRPVSRMGDRWTIGAMSEPRPLYRLPGVLTVPLDAPIVVCEGEKATDAALRCGLVATTSAGGAQAAAKSDWSPLQGRGVVVLPDNDDAGERYAADVARLSYAAGAASVRILRLVERCPALPVGGDLADVLESADACGAAISDGADPEDFGRLLLDWAAAIDAEPNPADGEALEAIDWQPYPVEALPEAIRRYVKEEAAALGCEAAMVALPLVAALGAAIGTTRRVIVKPGWRPYPILWTALVAESGQLKSPALRAALQWTRRRDDEAVEAAAEAQKAFDADMAVYEAALTAWKRKGEGLPPVKPAPVPVPRYCVNDTTIEALAPILRDNPRGVLLCRDELAGWFGAFDRYANAKGGDVATWLSAYNAESLRVDRKTSGTIHVARAAVAIVGGIQPRVLSRALGEANRENGLAARFLFIAPPPRPKRFTKAAASAAAIEAVAAVFSRLFCLEHTCDDGGRQQPVDVALSPEAEAAFAEFYNRHGAELATLTGDLAAAFSKLEELPARLALILHHVRLAAGEFVEADMIDADTMRAAIVLTEWHKRETRRVYALLDTDPADQEQRELLDWIRSHGGETTVRQLTGCGPRRWRGRTEEAEAALSALATAGRGRWEMDAACHSGGRPKRVFRLEIGGAWKRNPKKRGDFEGFVSVSTVATSRKRPEAEDSGNIMPPDGRGIEGGTEDVNRLLLQLAEER